jgi:hypothetical protein
MLLLLLRFCLLVIRDENYLYVGAPLPRSKNTDHNSPTKMTKFLRKTTRQGAPM